MIYKEVYDFIENNYDIEHFNGVKNALVECIRNELDSCGIMYRLFGRVKEKESIITKIEKKYEKYITTDTRLQDVIGIRIVLYFKDDIDICIRLLKDRFIEDNHEYDDVDATTFKPTRINYVFYVPEKINTMKNDFKTYGLIDNTFEIQLRTMFSEGWHEVEHDIRYKNITDWENENEMARDFNAILAVLEMCDNNILGICDNLAYNKYKEQKIEPMIRNRFRLRFEKSHLSSELECIIHNNYDTIGKQLFRMNRDEIIWILSKSGLKCTFDNVVFITNAIKIKNDDIYGICPKEVLAAINEVTQHEGFVNKRPYSSIVAMKHIL